MRLDIPNKFLCVNRTWRVRRVRLKRHTHGDTNFDKARVRMSRDLVPGSELELHTFLHELLHVTSGAMGWDEVNGDETRLDALAGLLAQAITTATHD